MMALNRVAVYAGDGLRFGCLLLLVISAWFCNATGSWR